MPDAVTHCFLAEAAKNACDIPYLNNHFDLMQIGSQGPDPFFYYHFLPWMPNNGSNKLASSLHTESTKPFLELIISLADDDESKAWVCGFLTHFSLDTVAHPYVFYRTGLYNKDTQENRGYHLMLERAIDNIYIEQRGNYPNIYNIKVRHFSRNNIPQRIVDILNQAGATLYDRPDMGDMYRQGYKDFRNAFRWLNFDPIGFKKVLFKLLDRVTKGEILYSALSAYNYVNAGIDYMNLQRNTWHHPSTNEPFNLTFDELFGQAVQKATQLITTADQYFTSKDASLFSNIKDESYDTGLPCGTAPMKHFNIMY
jgi:hypothetical protein